MRHVAAFDLDGTLTRRDTVVPFVASLRGWPRVSATLATRWQDVAAAAVAGMRRDQAKAALVATLAGVPERDLREAGERYAARVFSRSMRADVVAQLLRHQRRSHEVILVSAGLDAYVRPLADHLGVDAVYATRLEIGDDGCCTGSLDGPNVRGSEKVRCLARHLAGDHAEVWAYGNSADDRPLRAAADHPVLGGRAPRPPDTTTLVRVLTG
jgi:phosphatidylglycerophosphatase C